MGVALPLIGILAVLAGVVLHVWALVRKSGWGVVRSFALGGVGVILVIVGITIDFVEETEKPGTITPATPASQETAPTREPTLTPNPLTAEEAIAMVRASPEMSEAAAPFKQELDWRAEWVEDRWWVVGLFESPWGVKFVSDGTILNGKVYAYIDYSMRPAHEWVKTKAREWGLQHLYTRLMPDEALARVKESGDVRYALRDATVVDEVAELVKDSAISQAWRFAFYVLRVNGDYAVLVVEGYGGEGAGEGNFVGDYGFGNATKVYEEVPLRLLDWVRDIVKTHSWDKAVNLPQ